MKILIMMWLVAKLAEILRGGYIYNIFINLILTTFVVDKVLYVVTIETENVKTRQINLYIK